MSEIPPPVLWFKCKYCGWTIGRRPPSWERYEVVWRSHVLCSLWYIIRSSMRGR